MKILIKWFKMQLSLKAREDQAVEVSNQNLIYQEFKFEVPKCYLVWTDILSKFSEFIEVESDHTHKRESVLHRFLNKCANL
jgi:hypothetical protein